MSILNALSNQDYKAFIKYMLDCGNLDSSAAELPHNKENTLSLWANNNKHFFKMLGNNLIITREIDYHEPQNDLIQKMCQFLRDSAFANNFPKFFREKRLAFDNSFAGREEIGKIEHRLECGPCFATGVMETTLNFYNPKNPSKPIVCTPSMKTMRLLKKLVEAYDYDMDEFEDFRIKASQVNNTAAIKGELCLSIHPIDFATMSDNSNGWSSCMSWEGNGDYRAGTLEMLNSPCIIIAYIKSNTAGYYLCDGYEWNSKKWRELFIVNKDVIMGIKDYPYHSEETEQLVMDWIKELAEANLGWKYEEQDRVIDFNDSNHNYLFKATTQYMYNDLMACYNYKNCYGSKEFFETKNYIVDLSPAIQCPNCGKTAECVNNLFMDTCDIVCIDCGKERHHCVDCGDMLYDGDEVEIADGIYVCQCCYEENYFKCAHCGLVSHNESENIIDLRGIEYSICDYCCDKLEEVFPLSRD